MIGRGWRWWLTKASPVDEARVTSGEPLALIGDRPDTIDVWAAAIDATRAVLDLRDGRPPATVGQVRRAFAEGEPIVLASRPERVIAALGLGRQAYYLGAVGLHRRPGDAMALLQAAIDERTSVPRPLASLGSRAVALQEHRWRGLGEIRVTARYVAALLDARGNLTGAARALGVSRQAITRALDRRT